MIRHDGRDRALVGLINRLAVRLATGSVRSAVAGDIVAAVGAAGMIRLLADDGELGVLGAGAEQGRAVKRIGVEQVAIFQAFEDERAKALACQTGGGQAVCETSS